MPTTTNYGFYSPPLTGVTPNVPRDTKTLADAVDVALKAEETARIAATARVSSSRLHAAATSIPNTTFTTIPFDTVELDEIPWDNTNKRFTVTAAGYYVIHAGILFAASSAGIRQIRILKNAAAAASVVSHPVSASSGFSVQIARTLKLAASDTITVQAYQNTGGALVLSPTGAQVFVDITQIGLA